MLYIFYLFLTSLFCSLFSCGCDSQIVHNASNHSNGRKPKNLPISGNHERRSSVMNTSEIEENVNVPLVVTRLGAIQGFKKKIDGGREIFAFTGVPYGEPTTGNLRFRPPVPRKPWKGILKATSPSPFCIQVDPVTMIRGQEDCLYLDIYTPRISTKGDGKGLPVIIWIFGGANYFGRSKFYGPNYILREDVVFVVPNVRVGIFGFLSTGDSECSGNWALKDQSLVVQFVYDNIEAFGGDPNKIIIGGISSGAYMAQSMLFTEYETRKYIKGIIAISGTVLINFGLDPTGRVQKSSDIVTRAAGCPTAAMGKSKEMMECLRKVDPIVLGMLQYSIAPRWPICFAEVILQFNPDRLQEKLRQDVPLLALSVGPTIEPNVTDAFITELPETLYEKGKVPSIPMIVSRTEDETGLVFSNLRNHILPLASLKWNDFIQKFFKLGYRSFYGSLAETKEETLNSIQRIHQFYLNKTTRPVLSKKQDFNALVKAGDDVFINAPMWKMIEYHHKIAPTYAYIMKHLTFNLNPAFKIIDRIFKRGFTSSHAADFALLFNNGLFPPLKRGSDLDFVSRNLINFFGNFARYGKPLYRTRKGELLPLWRPVEDMNRPNVLEVGLLHNVSMIRDPLVGTERLRIWESIKL